MKNEHKFISKLVKDIEDKFSVLAYAYRDGNKSKTHVWWTICVNNCDLYYKTVTSLHFIFIYSIILNVIF